LIFDELVIKKLYVVGTVRENFAIAVIFGILIFGADVGTRHRYNSIREKKSVELKYVTNGT
jgi:hypothetical protein